jgi:hypothetical protein
MKKKVSRSTRSGGDTTKQPDTSVQPTRSKDWSGYSTWGQFMKGDKGDQSATTEPAVPGMETKPTDTQSTVTNNPLLPAAASGLSDLTSGLTSGVSSGLTSLITSLNALKLTCKNTGVITTFRLSVPSIIGFLNIPTDHDERLNKILGTDATLSDLITDVLKSFECKDIDVLVNILPQVLLFDKIGELLEKTDFSTLDETAKNSMDLYKNLKTIINDPKSHDLLCAILNKMESNKHIKSEHKMAFIKLFGGNEEICKGMLSKFGDSMKSTFGSLFGNKSGDEANTDLDTRCGENQIVKKSWFSGDYCAPKSNEAPVPAASGQPPAADGPEGQPPAAGSEGAPAAGPEGQQPTTDGREGQQPTTDGREGQQPPAGKDGEAPAADGKEGQPPPAGKDGEAPAADGKDGQTDVDVEWKTNEKKSSWWGGKYKRVKHTKKSKKSKSKKSKSKKSKRSKK